MVRLININKVVVVVVVVYFFKHAVDNYVFFILFELIMCKAKDVIMFVFCHIFAI